MPRGPRRLTFEKGTLGRFILSHQISLEWIHVPRNPFWPEGRLEAVHYYVKLMRPDGREMSLYYSKGLAHRDPPNPEEVMASIGEDALVSESYGGKFEEWAVGAGYDPEDPKFPDMIKEMKETVVQLKEFLGEEGYKELVALGERGALGRKERR